MGNKINPTINIGDKFGSLIIIEYCKGNSKGCWKCLCNCGKICYASSNHLIYGLRKGCGCQAKFKKDNLKRGIWEEWEITFLRLCYPIFNILEIAQYLNRPERNVVYCLSRNKIYKTIKSEILIGQIYDKLTVIDIIEKINKVGRLRKFAICKCLCGNITKARFDSLIDKSTKSCGCGIGLLGNKSPLWKGYGEISGSQWWNIKGGASKRSIKFEISIEEAWELFLKQNRKCKITGLDIHFAKTRRGKFKNKTTASLDRIDSKDYYHINNIQWLHKDVGKMKQDLNQEYFLGLCRIIAENNKKEII